MKKSLLQDATKQGMQRADSNSATHVRPDRGSPPRIPRWVKVLAIIGVILNIVDAPLSGTPGSVVGIVSFVLFALAVGWMGYALWTAKGEALRQPDLSV